MASTTAEVMTAIETAIDAIPGLHVARIIRDNIVPPIAMVGVPTIPAYHATMQRGKLRVEPTITVLTSAAYDRTGQVELAEFSNPTGASSVVVAVETDKTLGGVVDDCYVVDFRPLGLQEVGAVGYYGGVFNLRCIMSGV